MSQNEPPSYNQAYTWTGDSVDPNNPYTADPWITTPNITTMPNINAPNITAPDVVPYMPPELMVCVVCGVDDVLIFCDACKEVIREARKQWARDFLEEIEDALS